MTDRRDLSLCNEGRELDRDETLTLKSSRRLGFAGEERQIARQRQHTKTEDKWESRLWQ